MAEELNVKAYARVMVALNSASIPAAPRTTEAEDCVLSMEANNGGCKKLARMAGQCWEHWDATKGELPDNQVMASTSSSKEELQNAPSVTTEEIQLKIKSCGSKDKDNAVAAVDPAVPGLSKENVSRQLGHVLEMAKEVAADDLFFCTQVASVVKVAVADDPSKITQIRQIADVCHSFVKRFDGVVDSIRKGEEPKSICNNLQKYSVDGNPAKPELTEPDMIAFHSRNKDGNFSAYCSGVATVLKHALAQKPERVKEMRESAGLACGKLPADDTCHDDLRLYDEAVANLQVGKDPQDICES
ncbi:hypothetical protein P3T76_004515 [Phytophthora citrophthora]|uniref:Uncharacterized protein n=1 Tax=Phytophthora citrophthora TaxID=4793 RepID=A0AAD9LP64_9STRA|nr:hypothetical protein P3T76_004515 [Phytophthora citrophthora]